MLYKDHTARASWCSINVRIYAAVSFTNSCFAYQILQKNLNLKKCHFLYFYIYMRIYGNFQKIWDGRFSKSSETGWFDREWPQFFWRLLGLRPEPQMFPTQEPLEILLQEFYSLCHPNNSVKALKGKIITFHRFSHPFLTWGIFQPFLWPLNAPGYLGKGFIALQH